MNSEGGGGGGQYSPVNCVLGDIFRGDITKTPASLLLQYHAFIDNKGVAYVPPPQRSGYTGQTNTFLR